MRNDFSGCSSCQKYICAVPNSVVQISATPFFMCLKKCGVCGVHFFAIPYFEMNMEWLFYLLPADCSIT